MIAVCFQCGSPKSGPMTKCEFCQKKPVHHRDRVVSMALSNDCLSEKNLKIGSEYIKEKKPLGTVGALSLILPKLSQSFLVTNGDLLTDIKYRDLLDFHFHFNSDATMAVKSHEWQNPFGVVETNGIEIIGYKEKPVIKGNINAGVYVLSPQCLDELDFGEPCDMPTLFTKLQKKLKSRI